MTSGMDDVVAAETVLSQIDGEAGRLILRGYDIGNLAGRCSFEEVTDLLWTEVLEAGHDENLARAIGAGRALAFQRFSPLTPYIADLEPIEGMRFLLSAIGEGDDLAEPAALAGATGVAAAVAIRAAGGKEPVAPDAADRHARDVLRMATGGVADNAAADALETYLVTVMDHGLNASTFTARVVASTRAGLPSVLVAALSALKGPLHGGAPGPVLDMLDAIGSAENARPWINDALDRGERLMGFGHRVYRTRDPRADVLKGVVQGLSGRGERLGLAEAVEAAALDILSERKAGRRLDVNVEFYTALLLDAVGVPRSGFTPLFATGRVVGWLAHAGEQVASGRLIRPQSRYVGPMADAAA